MKKRGLLYTGITAIILGLISFVLKAIIGSTVDANGILHEPFFLLPLGYLLILLGIIFSLIYLIRNKKTSTH